MTDDERDQEHMRAVWKLWNMPLADVAKIEADPQHPLHEAAVIAGQRMMSPFTAAFQSQSAALGQKYQAEFGEWARKALDPVATAFRESGQTSYGSALENLVRSNNRAVSRVMFDPPLAVDVPQTGVEVDFSSDAPPEITVAEVHDAAESVVAAGLTQLLRIQQDQLDHMTSDARSREDDAGKDRTILVWGLIVGSLTLLATVVLGIANLSS
ncbi:hypothetical protein PTQ19_10330 [Microbacterium esteraromaticum]|uniref:hypothetical protein n=1 Tax=Microbacterium esteraromaticum TaxID=57043 RepID=UPI002368B456|nr:hypothetical protein [Microbacterium esteraromaticum]WDH77918.1 hypothetical protein PTQ19_10330 [Microbacterium esteraromaticum]